MPAMTCDRYGAILVDIESWHQRLVADVTCFGETHYSILKQVRAVESVGTVKPDVVRLHGLRGLDRWNDGFQAADRGRAVIGRENRAQGHRKALIQSANSAFGPSRWGEYPFWLGPGTSWGISYGLASASIAPALDPISIFLGLALAETGIRRVSTPRVKSASIPSTSRLSPR